MGDPGEGYMEVHSFCKYLNIYIFHAYIHILIDMCQVPGSYLSCILKSYLYTFYNLLLIFTQLPSEL